MEGCLVVAPDTPALFVGKGGGRSGSVFDIVVCDGRGVIRGVSDIFVLDLCGVGRGVGRDICECNER